MSGDTLNILGLIVGSIMAGIGGIGWLYSRDTGTRFYSLDQAAPQPVIARPIERTIRAASNDNEPIEDLLTVICGYCQVEQTFIAWHEGIRRCGACGAPLSLPDRIDQAQPTNRPPAPAPGINYR